MNDALNQALKATAADFERANTPPGRLFWDTDLYQRDLDEIFARHWLCVGHRSRLAEAGDFFVVDVGADSVIVVLGNDGEARAFLNVCRHRGTRISNEQSGRCRGFLCPYHAWHYGLDGKLKRAPLMEDVAGFDTDDYPLIAVDIDSIFGFLFINLSADAAPLADAFADFPDVSRYALPDLTRVAHHEYEVDANWKLICENYHECYHCQIAHPQLHRISNYGDLSNGSAYGQLFIGGPMAIRDGFNTMTISGKTDREPFAGCDGDDLKTVHYFNLLPNFLLSIAPDYVLTHHIWPRGPEHVFIESEWFFSADQVAADSFDPSDAIEFWDTTNLQDWKLCENALRGLKSRGHIPGRYQSGEDCTHRFHRWYIQTMFPDLA